MEKKIEEGTILIAKHNCKMKDGSGEALIIGKEYPVLKIMQDELIICSENSKQHYFETGDEEDRSYYLNYFDVKPITNPSPSGE
jgi:hypothetical protein